MDLSHASHHSEIIAYKAPTHGHDNCDVKLDAKPEHVLHALSSGGPTPAPVCGGGSGGVNIDFNGSHVNQSGHTEQVNVTYSNSHVSVSGSASSSHDWSGHDTGSSFGGKINVCF